MLVKMNMVPSSRLWCPTPSLSKFSLRSSSFKLNSPLTCLYLLHPVIKVANVHTTKPHPSPTHAQSTPAMLSFARLKKLKLQPRILTAVRIHANHVLSFARCAFSRSNFSSDDLGRES